MDPLQLGDQICKEFDMLQLNTCQHFLNDIEKFNISFKMCIWISRY